MAIPFLCRDVVEEVFRFVEPAAVVATLARVCRQWREITLDNADVHVTDANPVATWNALRWQMCMTPYTPVAISDEYGFERVHNQAPPPRKARLVTAHGMEARYRCEVSIGGFEQRLDLMLPALASCSSTAATAVITPTLTIELHHCWNIGFGQGKTVQTVGVNGEKVASRSRTTMSREKAPPLLDWSGVPSITDALTRIAFHERISVETVVGMLPANLQLEGPLVYLLSVCEGY